MSKDESLHKNGSPSTIFNMLGYRYSECCARGYTFTKAWKAESPADQFNCEYEGLV